MANEEIMHRLKILKKNGIQLGMICYKNGTIRISFQIPKELFNQNNMFEYTDSYLEATIEKSSDKKEIRFSAYVNNQDDYFVGDRPVIQYYWIKIHNKNINKLPVYKGKTYIVDENHKDSEQTKAKTKSVNKKPKKKKVPEEPKAAFNTPYSHPEPIKTNLCRHPSKQRTCHNQKVSPTKVYLGGKFS